MKTEQRFIHASMQSWFLYNSRAVLGNTQGNKCYHFCQQGAASIHHEGTSKVDLSTVHLELQITELRVVHHAAQV